MPRALDLARRAWKLRHDRVALATGLDRAGIRIPGSGSFRSRSPRVAVLVDRALAGHVNRSISELVDLMASGGRAGADAALGLADWHITHRSPQAALDVLSRCPSHSTEAVGLLLEARAMVGRRDSALLEGLSRVEIRRARRHSQIRWLLANASDDRLEIWNRLLQRATLAPIRADDGSLDSLRTQSAPTVDGPMVSVIVPAHNAAHTIDYSLRSLTDQTWRNIEILVIDDASTDATADIVLNLARTEPRLRLIRLTENVGAYGARNRGLTEASGDFVTVHDADDWAHPDRIRVQVEALLVDATSTGNLTSLVRVTDDLLFTRRGLVTGQVVGYNHSSLLIRRSVFDRIGPWDDTRSAADSEFIDRIGAVFGPMSLARLLPNVPLSAARNDPGSLIGSPTTGLLSTLVSTGARRLYHLAASSWHASPTFNDALPASRSSDFEPFPIPALLRRSSGTTDFDVCILSDLSLPGGTTASNLNEIAANELFGLSTALVHNPNPKYRDLGPNPKYFVAHSPLTRMVSYGEQIRCRSLVVKYPPSVTNIPELFPNIKVVGRIAAVINQVPFTGYEGDREKVYDLVQCDAEVRRVFGKSATWFGIGPAVRRVLHRYHADDITRIDLADEDWPEIIDLTFWKRSGRPSRSGAIRIGRHGRDDRWKWPDRRDDLLAAYPNDSAYEVRVLGGAETPRRLLGSLPGNWQVLPFDAVPPRDWLADLDVFVYFPHPDMVESFGRTILEALAVGVPVVCDSRFTDLFGDSVIACRPNEVLEAIDRIVTDAELYESLVTRGQRLVADRFSFEAHRERLTRLGG